MACFTPRLRRAQLRRESGNSGCRCTRRRPNRTRAVSWQSQSCSPPPERRQKLLEHMPCAFAKRSSTPPPG